MRAHVLLLAALTAASFATAIAQNTGNPAATPGAQAPVRQPQTSAPPATPSPSSQTSPMPSQPTRQETVRPNDPAHRAAETKDNATNTAVQQNRVPPASRGVGTTGSRPDCSKLRGIEKAECERRDTSRDDLPAGVTSTQPENKKEVTSSEPK